VLGVSSAPLSSPSNHASPAKRSAPGASAAEDDVERGAVVAAVVSPVVGVDGWSAGPVPAAGSVPAGSSIDRYSQAAHPW
jgi:hypothetical protein